MKERVITWQTVAGYAVGGATLVTLAVVAPQLLAPGGLVFAAVMALMRQATYVRMQPATIPPPAPPPIEPDASKGVSAMGVYK